MSASVHASVVVDLEQVRANARRIAASTGVALIAVVKADAYGLGASAVAHAIASLVDGFYVFDAAEAIDAGLSRFAGKYTIALHGGIGADRSIRPVVWTLEQAAAARGRPAVVSVDTGQQRFGCAPERLGELLNIGDFHEAMTHATTADQASAFGEALEPWGGRTRFRMHAAGSALLDHAAARFDAVRPGMALYQDATTVTARLVAAVDSTGPAGYTRFMTPRFGVILVGYSNGLRIGPCRISGVTRRVVEVGMQSAFVEIGPTEHEGDEVVLLGRDLPPHRVADDWKTTPQTVLVSLATCGVRTYVNG